MIAKKYIRVREHWRDVGIITTLVHAHIRKNPRFKEMKMNDERTEGETPRGDVGVREKSAKPFKLSQVSVVIFYADNHYLASFNHAPRRVFHNTEELLRAIEVACLALSVRS